MATIAKAKEDKHPLTNKPSGIGGSNAGNRISNRCKWVKVSKKADQLVIMILLALN